ncbi:MAG: DHH family phosphoesterase [Anaerovoracaceae bacterium]
MESKILKALISPFFKASTFVLIIFSLALLYFNIYAGVLGGVFVIFLSLLYWRLISSKTGLMEEYVKGVTGDLEDTIKPLLLHNPLPLCLVSEGDILIWYNQKFLEIFKEAKMFNSHFPELTGIRVDDFQSIKGEEEGLLVVRQEKTYRVIASFLDGGIQGGIMLYWLDITEQEKLKTLYHDEAVCYAHIIVDNYDELIGNSPDEKKSLLSAQIETIIRQWAGRFSATVIKSSNSRYFMVMEQKYFEKLEIAKFGILDEIRALESGADFPPSLSIGIGLEGKTLAESEEYALAALDLALGRGGDQAVVKGRNRVEYYGGKLQTVEKRNKGKSRIMAHAIRQIIDQSGKVVIMGHKNPDLDSFGAALGFYRMARNQNREAYIIINNYGASLSGAFQKVQETGQYNFMTNAEALHAVDRDTLIVVVDTHRPSLVECPELLSYTDKIVLIDHHRKAEDSIENATLTYMESYASSTSELVTEILQYGAEGKKAIEKLEAEILLAGITMDTKNFSIRTGVRTFEAASWLRRNGAETANVKQFFQVDPEVFHHKALTVANAEFLPGGIVFSIFRGQHHNAHIITSLSADELLNLQDVVASFVIGQNEQGITHISARSLGKINVQTLMEKLGGGGHLTMAAAQVDIPVEEAVEKIKELLNDIK